jgi:hypothetical protein
MRREGEKMTEKAKEIPSQITTDPMCQSSSMAISMLAIMDN